MTTSDDETQRQPEEEPVPEEDVREGVEDSEPEEDIESRRKRGEEALEEINEFLAFFKC